MSSFVTDNYKLDITPQGNYPIVYLSQYENGRSIKFYMLNRGRTFTIPTGISAFVSGLKPNSGYYEHSCTIDGNYVIVPVASDMTDVKGKGVANITFTNESDEKVISAKFLVNVQETVEDNGLEVPTSAETILAQILDEIRAEAASLNIDIAAIESNIATFEANINSEVSTFESGINSTVNTMNSRLDTFLATQTGVSNGTLRTETTLFESSQPAAGNKQNGQGFFDLLHSTDDYDYIEFWYTAFGRTGVIKCKPSDITMASTSSNRFHWSEAQFFSTDVIPPDVIDPNTVRIMLYEVTYTESDHTQIYVDMSIWGWTGAANTTGHLIPDSTFGRTWDSTNGIYKTTGYTAGIYNIIGIKYEDAGMSKDAELVDIRVGADGTEYESAGEAVRAQAANIIGTCLYIGEVPVADEPASQETSN